LLPILSFFYSASRFALLTTVVSFYAFSGIGHPIVFNFVLGALTAYAIHNQRIQKYIERPSYTLFPLFALVATFYLFDTAYGFRQSMMLFIFFIFVAQGNSLFGLLTTAPARLIGVISYSIYLLHSIVLFAFFYTLNKYQPIHTMAPTLFWASLFATGLIVIAISALSYRFIEYPFLTKRKSTT
jgi:peptidoglycan/LPS O-acetylase OafA/YrhL